MATAQLVSQPEKDVLYMARRSALRLTHTQRYPIRGAMGQQVGETPGVFPSFRDGVLRVPKEGEVKFRDSLNGGIGKLDAAEANAWLLDHPLYGDKEEGFWRVDPPPPPVSDEEQGRMMQAALALDVDTLRGMAEQERAGWGREQIIRHCEQSVAKIEEVKAQERERAEAEAAKTPRKPKA